MKYIQCTFIENSIWKFHMNSRLFGFDLHNCEYVTFVAKQCKINSNRNSIIQVFFGTAFDVISVSGFRAAAVVWRVFSLFQFDEMSCISCISVMTFCSNFRFRYYLEERGKKKVIDCGKFSWCFFVNKFELHNSYSYAPGFLRDNFMCFLELFRDHPFKTLANFHQFLTPTPLPWAVF